MATSGKKGKKAKGKAVPLQDFLAQTTGNGESTLASAFNPPKRAFPSWADDPDDEPNMPTPLIQLPTAPRASRSFDDDSVPKHGPFVAYCSNLPYDLDEPGLEDFFGGMNLVSVQMPREDGGRSRGYGYVTFETREDLIEAISLPDPTINNRHIRIDVSTENDRRQRQGGRYGDREPLTAGESNWRRAGPDAGGERRGGEFRDRGSNSRYSSQTAPRDTNSDWRVGERHTFDDAPSRRGGDDRDGGGFRDRYGGRRSNYEERSDRRDGPPRRDAEPAKERPKLNLLPRTLPIEPIVVTKIDDDEEKRERSPSPPRPKPVPAANIFGSAKPVDTAAREREIEERLEREREEERRLREEARDKTRNDDDEEKEEEETREEKAPAPKPAIISWRRQTDDEENNEAPRRDDRRDDRGGGGRDDRRGDDRRGGYRDDRRTTDYGRGGGGGERRGDRNDRRGGDRDASDRGGGGREWARDRDGNRGGDRGPVARRDSAGDKDHRNNNGLTEEEREQRLAEKMPKQKPPEGPNLSTSNKFAFLEGDDDDVDEGVAN